MSEQFTFFYAGPFSQWHMCRFVVDDVAYNCAEQFMMAEKARLFGDMNTLALIMAAKTPKEQKALGRGVTPYGDDIWLPEARKIIRRGNAAKFGQNPALMALLMATKGTTLVEASPPDRLYGIGLAANDPRAKDRSQWLGKNWLGEVLTQLREHLELQLSAPSVATVHSSVPPRPKRLMPLTIDDDFRTDELDAHP